MKILIIMEGFFPGKKYGGPPVSVDNFCSLMNEEECYIVTRNHDLYEKTIYDGINDGWNNRGYCKVKYLCDEKYNIKEFEEIVDELKPDLLYLQGLFQYAVLPCLMISKKKKLKVLLAPRGELCEGALKIRRFKKIIYIFLIRIAGLVKNIHYQSTSEEETNAIIRLMGVTVSRVHRLDNVPSILKHNLNRQEKKTGEGRFVYVSRIHPKKNLAFALECFQHIKSNAIFDIYGPIEDKAYWEDCKNIIDKMPANIKVEYKGIVNHDSVHEVFSKYDAFIFPTLSENYGHVIAESLIAGTPVIISNQTPWRGLEGVGAGWDIDLSDVAKYIESIQYIIELDQDKYNKMIQDVQTFMKKVLNLEELKNSYRQAIEYIVSD